MKLFILLILSFLFLMATDVSAAVKDYRLVKTKTDPRVYLVENNRRVHIPNEAAFAAGGYAWSEIETVAAVELNALPEASEFVFDLGVLGVEYPWNKSRLVDFKKYRVGSLGGRDTTLTDVNSNGAVVGYSEISGTGMDGGPEHAFLWRKKKMVDLGTLGGRTSKALAVNNRDEVVGCSQIKKSDKNCYPFIWAKGKMRQLNSGQGSAHDINDGGMIAGEVWPWAYRWVGGKEEKLAVPNRSLQTIARSVNNNGDIVGTAAFPFGDDLLENLRGQYPMPDLLAEAYSAKALLWRNGKVYDLDKLLPGDARLHLSDAVDINDKNQVVARGFREGSFEYRFFLVSLPLSMPDIESFDAPTNVLKNKLK